MKRTKYLLVFALPLIFIAGCIDGQVVININKNGSGNVTFEGLFDYASYSAITGMNPAKMEPFFLGQIQKMITNGGFDAWKDVQWKLLAGGKCYFKGTAYFNDINKIDFYIGSAGSNLKIFYSAEDAPTLELKYLPDSNAPVNPQLVSTLAANIVVTLPAKIEDAEGFKLLDWQTAMFTVQGGNLPEASGKLILAPDGNDLFDYDSQLLRAQKDFQKTLQNIDDRLKILNNTGNAEKLESQNPDFRMRQGLIAESQKDFNNALNIYENIVNDANVDEKYKAAAGYQTGVCLLKTGDREKAQAQFEYVINNFPSQRTAMLKSAKMLQIIRSEKPDKKAQEQKSIPSVIGTSPELYTQDVDPNIEAITITFSQSMKKTDWFYSSFSQTLMPQSTGLPFFDPCGVEWTLPVRLEPGKVYAITINYSDSDISNLKAQISNNPVGFRSVSEQKCEEFILLFATADANQEPTDIEDEILEKCDKINSKP